MNSDADIFKWFAVLIDSKITSQGKKELIQGAQQLFILIEKSISHNDSNPILYFILGKLQFMVITFILLNTFV